MRVDQENEKTIGLLDFLTDHPDTWHKIHEKESKAFERLQEIFGTRIMEFDGFADQMRFVKGG